jgi:GNAT superfamily N-acetyltransferase
MSGPARRATPDDIGEIRSILSEHGNDGPTRVHDIVGPYIGHLISTARALVVPDGEGLAAFGATVATGRGRHLTDLFVRKDRLGHGLGRPLLDAVFDGEWPRTTFASDDPRAMPLYVRAGMIPLWPCLYLLGSVTSLPRLDAALEVESADPSWIDALEQEWNGRRRSTDHAFWGRQADADPFVVLDAGEIIAAGYGRARQIGPERALDRLLVRADHEPIGPIFAAVRRVARDGTVLACLPGPNPAVRPLLEAGFRIQDRDTYMASEPDLVDPARFIPNPGML